MISCLENYIGLRGAFEEVADGGLWINDMPDAGIPKIEALSDVHSADFNGLWAKVYGRATDHFAGDIRKLIQPRIKTNEVFRNVISGKYDPTPVVVSSANEYSGVLIDVYGSPFMDFVLNEVWIYSDAIAQTDVFVFDAITGVQLYTKIADLVEGHNRVPLGFSCSLMDARRKFFVCYMRNSVNSLEVTSGEDTYSCDACNGSVGANTNNASAPFAPNPTTATITTDSAGKGLIATWGLRCSINAFICQYKDILAIALRWKAYIELLAEQLWNDSLTNKYTLLPREELEARMQAAQLSYQDELSGVLKAITWEADAICWDCNESASITYLLP